MLKKILLFLVQERRLFTFSKRYEVECDHDPIYQTQDAYTYLSVADPEFTPYPPIGNAYLVEWNVTRTAKNKLIVVFTKEKGAWKIDNLVEFFDGRPNDHLLFDYSKPPVPAYE